MPAASETPAKTTSAGPAPRAHNVPAHGRLARANDIRTHRARLKKDLKAGRVQIHGLLLDPPEYLQTAKVFDLLLAVPKYGRVKVNRILTHCRISPSKTIGGLSAAPAQRAGQLPAPLEQCPAGPRHHGSLGRGQGHADPGPARAHAGLRLRVSATTRAARPGEERRHATTGSSATRSSSAGWRRGSSSSTPSTPATATARCAPRSSAGPAGDRARDRRPGRAPGRETLPEATAGVHSPAVGGSPAGAPGRPRVGLARADRGPAGRGARASWPPRASSEGDRQRRPGSGLARAHGPRRYDVALEGRQ